MRRWHRPDLEEGWADRARAAEMLGITVRTLLRWHHKGKGPPRRRNGAGLRSVKWRIGCGSTHDIERRTASYPMLLKHKRVPQMEEESRKWPLS